MPKARGWEERARQVVPEAEGEESTDPKGPSVTKPEERERQEPQRRSERES